MEHSDTDELLDSVAALTLQRVWRGHVARRQTGKARDAIIKIQSVWRGFQARRVRQQSHAFRERADETDLHIRIGQLRARVLEYEFEVLRSLPAKKLEHYLRLRRRYCARRLQRWWRRVTGRPPFGSQLPDQTAGAPSAGAAGSPGTSARTSPQPPPPPPPPPPMPFRTRVLQAYALLKEKRSGFTKNPTLAGSSREQLFEARAKAVCARSDMIMRTVRELRGGGASADSSLLLRGSLDSVGPFHTAATAVVRNAELLSRASGTRQ